MAEHRGDFPANGSQPTRYTCNDPQAAVHLHERGYVVFDSVISPAECEQALNHFWDWIGEVTGERVVRGWLESYRH